MKRTDLSARVNLAKSAYDVNKRYNLAFDLGVNVGGFSKAYFEKFDKIVAIEAHPQTYEFAKKNLSQYENIEVHNYAVYKDSSSKVNLFEWKEGDCGSTSLINLDDNQQLEYSQSVDTIDFDSMVSRWGMPNYIKIDVEGSEYDFLMGKDLSEVDFIAIEIHYGFLSDKKIEELLAHLLQYFDIEREKKGVKGVSHPEYNLINKNYYINSYLAR